jgi:aminoglycoside 6'-N-acetyltransferase I
MAAERAARHSGDVHVRPVGKSDASTWLRMRCALWPEGRTHEHRRDVDRYFAGRRHEPKAVLVAFDATESPLGFVELSIRNIVDSCETDRVAYLEGWYVVPGARRTGVGAALIAAAEQWGVEQGCTELGSDSLVDNRVSRAAHLALGFEETGVVRNYRKDLVRRSTVARNARGQRVTKKKTTASRAGLSPAAKRDREDKVRLRAYIAKLPLDQRRALEALRTAVRAAVPASATDAFSYGIPAIRLDGRIVVWFAAWKQHTSLYPITATIKRDLATEIEGYATSKGTIRFPLAQPIPAALVKRLVKARVADVKKGSHTA